MHPAISTHLFLQQRLTPALLDTLHGAGARGIEVFAARHHFDYADRAAVREIANWFRSNNVTASLHMPLFSADEEQQWSRHTPATLNLIDSNKSERIATMDEVKRALEAAEQVPFRACVIHLGQKDDKWSTRTLDDSLTAIEHLKAFAGPLGVKLLLENLSNSVATPAHLVEIVHVGHFSGVGFCLDTGHAHIAAPSDEWLTKHASRMRDEAGENTPPDGLAEAFEVFGDNLNELHLHDNGGMRDEHCWPGDSPHGGLDWKIVRNGIAALKEAPAGVLEIAHDPAPDMKGVAAKAAAAWRLLGIA
ncbi:MAG TPA: TIM barrel protein [Acidobacteriaceae bacterium]|jgi:sugar phosphate isomerase/epimerase